MTTVWKCLLGVACLWLMSPMLFSPELEGYTAHLSSLALNHGPDAIGRVFPDLYGQGEYLYDTRIGVIAILRLLGELSGNFGPESFHALMIASFAVFALATIAIVRRFVPVDGFTAFLALMLVPGAVDTAFFFNDNLTSAAFALGGLALVCWRDTVLAYAVAGLLLGYAVMCRTDAIFVAPMLAGVCWIARGMGMDLVRRGAASIAGLLVTLALFDLLTGVNVFDAIRIAAQYRPGYAGAGALHWMLLVALLGLPGAVFLVIGALLNLRAWQSGPQSMRRAALFIWYPLAVTIGIAIPTSAEVRHLYPLIVPLIVAHIAAALAWLGTTLRRARGKERRAPMLLVLAVAACMALPPWVTARPLSLDAGYAVHDGPRSFYAGRLWMPLLWYRWQMAQSRSYDGARAFAAELDRPGLTTVMTTNYSDSGYLTLALFERGFRTEPVGTVFPGCDRSAVMAFRHGDSTVALIRTENQYGRMRLHPYRASAFLTDIALSCPPVREAGRIYLTAMGTTGTIDTGPVKLNWVSNAIPDLIPDPYRLSDDLSPFAVNLLSDPFVARPASERIRHDWVVRVWQVWPLSPAELAEIHRAASDITREFSYSYDDMQRSYAPLHARQTEGR